MHICLMSKSGLTAAASAATAMAAAIWIWFCVDPELERTPMSKLVDLKEALRESTIPFIVETRDWARLPQNFHREIMPDYVVLVAVQ